MEHAELNAITFTLNGKLWRGQVRPNEALLETLRERCQIKSIKDGCHPQGQCGSCLTLVDGHPRITCTLPSVNANGAIITTLEGLSLEQQKQCVHAFTAAASGGQCGFCVPAIALHATALLDRHPNPSHAEISRVLDLHLCRCSGYEPLIHAIELLAKLRRGDANKAVVAGGVGVPVARIDATEQILGRRLFVADMDRPHMLRGVVVLSHYARARVLRIDTAKACAIAGVMAVVTAKDVPGERWYGLIEEDWPAFVAEGEEVRCVGDVLAAIAAEDEATAREAARVVEVTYVPLDPVVDPLEALEEGAPQVNPCHANLLARTAFQRGDTASALAGSAHVATGTFRTQRVEHLFLEPECALAEPLSQGRIRLYTQGQGVFDDRRQVAKMLGMADEQLVVELVPSGGAFGGKEDLSIQAHAALLAQKTGRPVKLALNREESIRMHPKRHPMTIDLSVGCDDSGLLTAVRARLIGDSGAYASVGAKVLERAAGHACGPYRVPNVDVEAIAVTTNNPPSGAMRGFGVPQMTFALEGCLDELAVKVGLDPWEIRFRNTVDIGDTITTGEVLKKSVGIKRTLVAVKEAYETARRAGRAVGIACGIKNSGIGNGVVERGRVRLVVEPGGRVTVFNGFSEMGQGLLTILVQMAVEVTGLDNSVFCPRVDTTWPLDCGQTTASRGTLLAGRAIVDAAQKLRADLDSGKTLDDLVGHSYEGEVEIRDTTPLGAEGEGVKTHTAYGYATQVAILDEHGRVDRVIAAHDVGRAINPTLCMGQIEGAIAMGLGYALTEQLPCEQGVPQTIWIRELGPLRAHDMPKVEVILVEEPDPEGPFGAKGVGEIGMVPTAACVAGALAAFDGIRRYELPMKDTKAAHFMSVGPHHRHPHHVSHHDDHRSHHRHLGK